jgi:GGDEF domain-containing protein
MDQDSLEDDKCLRLIHLAIEEVVAFFAHVSQDILYPDQEHPIAALSDVPAVLDDLMQADLASGGAMVADLAGIKKLHTELCEQARMIGAAAVRGQLPPAPTYTEFGQMFEELVRRLRRLEQARFWSDAGFDVGSGLRNADAMMKDLKRELEHVARRGIHFSLVLMRLEKSEDLALSLGAKYIDMLRWLGDHIRKCARVFDDAYRLEKDLFLVTLKHTDHVGVQSFINRLLEQTEVHPFYVDSQRIEAKFTFCTSQPIMGEDVSALLQEMKQDLGLGQRQSDVISHQEISPLQRFMFDQGQGKKS